MNVTSEKKTVKRPSFYYGWLVLAASFTMLFFNSGAQFSIGVMFKPIINDLGWNRSAISFVAFVNMAFYAFSMLLMGKAYDRYGPKWVILVSVAFLCTGLIGVSFMTNLLEFVLFYGVLSGIGLSGCTILIFSSLISKWFGKRQGLVISIALSGSCLGQFVLIPTYTDFLVANGWRSTYLFIGVVTFVVNFLLTFSIVKGDPEQLGYSPLGNNDAGSPYGKTVEKETPNPNRDSNLAEAAKTGSFWLYVIVMFVCGAGDFLISTHLIPFVTDFGIPQKSASLMLAWYGLFSLIGIIVAGYASDLIGNKIPILSTFVLRVLLFILILNIQTKVSFYIFSLGFGFTMLITGVLTVTLIGKMFGYSNIGALTGFITTIHHLGGGISVYAGGMFYDDTGTYKGVFILCAAMSLVAVVSCGFIRERKHQNLKVENNKIYNSDD